MKNFALHFWPTIGSCDHNEYSQRICSGFAKLYRFIFESNLDSVGAFDLLLLYSFVIIFLAFLVASAFTIFEEDQKSLQQIKGKVKLSSKAIANLAAAFWAIKESRFKSITYEGYMRISKSKSAILKIQESDRSPKEPKPVESTISNESSTKKSKLKPTNSRSPSRSPTLKKIGITRLPQQQKKLSSIFNVPNKKSKFFRSSGSSSSLHPKLGLTSGKSQHSMLSIDSRKTKFDKKKSVQIDEPAK